MHTIRVELFWDDVDEHPDFHTWLEGRINTMLAISNTAKPQVVHNWAVPPNLPPQVRVQQTASASRSTDTSGQKEVDKLEPPDLLKAALHG